MTTWLAFGPAVLAGVLLLNGALDRSPIQLHRQFVVNKQATRGRWGSTTYHLEVTSWRPDRETEKFEVSGPTFGEFGVNDPVTVALHMGALAIPWVSSIRRTSPQ